MLHRNQKSMDEEYTNDKRKLKNVDDTKRFIVVLINKLFKPRKCTVKIYIHYNKNRTVRESKKQEK